MILQKMLTVIFAFGLSMTVPASNENIIKTQEILNKKIGSFDLFLEKLEEKLSCKGGKVAIHGICISSAQIYPESGIVTVGINLSPKHLMLSEFTYLESSKKEDFLKSVINNVAVKLGVAQLPGTTVRNGEIQKVEFFMEGIDTFQLKEEFAQNVIVEIYVPDDDNIYWVIRGLDTEISIIKLNRKELDEKLG